jgi:hypothetical protein
MGKPGGRTIPSSLAPPLHCFPVGTIFSAGGEARRQKGRTMAMARETETNRREYSRVYAYIPLAVRKVMPDEHAVVRARLAGDSVLPGSVIVPELGDRMLSEWLRMINGKVDSIIRMLTLQSEGFQCLPAKAVQISGSGLSFSSAEPFDPGDLLEMKMILTVGHPMAIFAYGEVIKAERQTSGHVVAVSFVKMDDPIRDEIVRFVFEREREILREKRTAE